MINKPRRRSGITRMFTAALGAVALVVVVGFREGLTDTIKQFVSGTMTRLLAQFEMKLDRAPNAEVPIAEADVEQLMRSGQEAQALKQLADRPDSPVVLTLRGEARFCHTVRVTARTLSGDAFRQSLAVNPEVTRARADLLQAKTAQAYLILGQIEETCGSRDAAVKFYLQALDVGNRSEKDRARLAILAIGL